MNSVIPKPTQKSQSDKKYFTMLLFQYITDRNLEAFKNLMESENLDPNLKDNDGGSLLLYSARDDKALAFTEYLITKGASINSQDNSGFSALFKAAYLGNKETVKFLINQENINLNQENSAFAFILNPVTVAILKDYEDIVKRLLWNGADPFKAESLILSGMQLFLRPYNGKYRYMIDFYKRWPNGKKQILFALYCSKKKGIKNEEELAKQSQEELAKELQEEELVKEPKKSLFDVSRLPISFVIKLADEYL